MAYGKLIMTLSKHLPWLLLVLAIGGVALYYYKDARSTAELLSLKNKELMKANLELGRAHTIITEQKKVQEAALADINKKWKEEIDKRKALITAYGQLQAKLEIEKKKVKTITKIRWKERNLIRTIELPKGKLFVRQENGKYKQVDSLSYSYKDFRISIKGDVIQQTLSYKLHQKFKGQLVATVLPSGAKNHYAKIFEIDDKGKVVQELKLTHLDILTSNNLPKRMMWWNPKVDLGLGIGITSNVKTGWIAELGFSTSAYGITKDDITWRFIRFGMGVAPGGMSLTFSPVQLNIGKFLPLVSNMWLTPYAGYNLGRSVGHFGLGLSVVF